MMSNTTTSRRRRIQARPNISGGMQAPKQITLLPSKQRADGVNEPKDSAKGSDVLVHPNKPDLGTSCGDSQARALGQSSYGKAKKQRTETLCSSGVSSHPLPPMKSSSVAPTIPKCAASSSKKSIGRSGSPGTGHKTSKWSISGLDRLYTKSSKVTAKARKHHSGDEPLDPKKVKMSDMIRWNPKNETALNRNSDKAKNKKVDITETQQRQHKGKPQTEHDKATKKVAAPQVKISEDGSLVLDESSLTIVNDHSSGPLETVNEGSVGRKVTSSSFCKRPRRKGTQWSDLETEFFYDILRATGPDFGLMHEFFPSRTRDELKNKFNREEKSNLARLNEMLSSPRVLNESLFTHAEEVMKKINEEAQKKKERKMSKEARKALRAAQQKESQHEEDANSVSNSSAPINGADPAAGEQSTKKSVKKNANKNSKKKGSSKTSIIGELGEDFPKFDIVEEPDADGVSLERKDDGLPVVRVSVNTAICAFPRENSRPERIVFDCRSVDGHPSTPYLLQDRVAVNDRPSEFLHLFGPPKQVAQP